jgi:hypothetical protein
MEKRRNDMVMIVGIDPGKKGGIVVMSSEGLIRTCKMPLEVDGDIDADAARAFIYCATLEKKPNLVVLEKVRSMTGQGVKSMFTFGRGYEAMLTLCKLEHWKRIDPRPQEWQKLILKGRKRFPGKMYKTYVPYVKARYPDAELRPEGCRVDHDGVAAAVCLAEFGFRSDIDFMRSTQVEAEALFT